MVLEGADSADVNQSDLQMLQCAVGSGGWWSSKPAFCLRWLKSFSRAFCCSTWMTWKLPVIGMGQKNLIMNLISFLSRYQCIWTCDTGSPCVRSWSSPDPLVPVIGNAVALFQASKADDNEPKAVTKHSDACGEVSGWFCSFWAWRRTVFGVGLHGEFATFGCMWEMVLNVIFLVSSARFYS